MNRSGTKWISNLISNHTDVTSVQYERGGGILETNMFTNFTWAFGDLKYPDNYVGLIELWSETDFFKCAGMDKELFYRLEKQPADYFELFSILMDKYATDRDKKYWLQKVNPYDGVKCIANYPDAHLIVIKRNLVDVIRSSVKMKTTKYPGSKKNPVKEVFFYVFQEKILNSIKAEYTYVKFENLKANQEKEVKRICEALSLEYDPSVLESKFKPNTSFKKTEERASTLPRQEVLLIKIAYAFFRLFPLFLFKMVHRTFKKDTARFIPGTFGFIKDQYDIQNII